MAKTTEKLVLGVVFVLILGLNSFLIFGSSDANLKAEDTEVKTAEVIYITEAEARDIAQKYYGGSITEVEEKTVNGVTFYEIELEDEFIETEVKISKKNGNILRVEQDKKEDENEEDLSPQEVQNIDGTLTEEQAIAIAKDLVDGRLVSVDAEREDGFLIYEIELESDGELVEIEIDAETGEVLEVEWGEDDDDDD